MTPAEREELEELEELDQLEEKFKRPSARAIPESRFGAFFRSAGESFRAQRSPTQLLTDIAGQNIPQIDPIASTERGEAVFKPREEIRAEQARAAERIAPEKPKRLAEKVGQVAGMIGKEALDPIAVGLMRVPGGAGLRARLASGAVLGGGYEAGSTALGQVAQEGEISDPAEIAARGAAGAIVGPVLGEVVRGTGKAIKGAIAHGRAVPTAATSPPRSVGAAEAVTGAFSGAKEEIEEVAERGLGHLGEAWRQVSRLGAKSVSYLDEPAKFSPTLKSLREEIEHSDLPGKGTSTPDFNERALLATGAFHKQFEEALPKAPVGGLRPLFDDIHRYAREAGVDIGYIRGYFPRVYDTNKLSKEPVGQAFIKVLSKYGIDPADADIIRRNLTDSDGVLTSVGAGRSTISRIAPEHQRMLGDIPDQELAPFLRTDPKEVIPQYISGVVRRAEYARTFGANNEKLHALKDKIRVESLQSGRPIRHDEFQRIDDLAEALAGDYRRIQSRWARQTNDLATTYQYVRTLPIATLSSLSEPFIAMERGGLSNAVKAIPATVSHAARGILRTVFKGVDKAQATKDLEEIGLGLDETLAQVLNDQFSGAGGAAGLSATIQKGFFKLNLLSPWTRMTQVHSMKTAENLIKGNIKSLLKTANKRKEHELADLGLDPTMAKQWFAEGAKRDSPYYLKVQQGMLRFVNETIMHPRGTVKPMVMNNPKIKLLTMLKGYHVMAGNTIGKRMLWKLTKGSPVEKARVVGAVGAMLSTALLSDEIRNYIKYELGAKSRFPNRDDKGDLRNKKETGMDMLWRAVKRSMPIGVLQFANDYQNAPRFGSSGIQQLLGPAVSQAEEMRQAVTSAGEGRPGKLRTEVINALPLINMTPRTRAYAKEQLFGLRTR